MRCPWFTRLVGSAGVALFGSLLWLPRPVFAQEPARAAAANASGAAVPIDRGPLWTPVAISLPGTPAAGGNALPGVGALEGAPPKPTDKPDGGKDLLDLPLEELAAQPVRVPLPEAAAPGVAAAGAEPTAAAPPAGLGPIVSAASRHEERVSAAPAGVVVIDRKEIVERGYSLLTDVLRDLPGMETTEFDFSEFGTQVAIRGIVGNNKIVVLVNGMRVNPPGGENFPFKSDFSVRFAERIEVVYGSGGVLYGQDAISAVINIVTKKPGEDANDADNASPADQLANTTSKLTIQAGGNGGVNLEREAYGWFGGVLDKQHDVTYNGYIQYHNSDLTPIDQAFPAYWQAYRQIALPKTNGDGVTPSREDYGLNIFGQVSGFGSSIQVWHRESERSSAEGYSPALGFLPQARWADQSTVIEGKNTLHLTDRVSLESTVGYSYYQIRPITLYVEPVAPALTSTDWFLMDNKYGIGLQGRQEETLRVELPDRISLLAGEAIFHADIIPKSTIPGGYKPGSSPVDQGGFFSYTDSTGTHTIPQVTQSHYWDYSPYVEAQWQILDRVRLIAGTRVTWDDRFQTVPITPRAALIYNVTDRITAKYLYTEGFVAPAPYFADATYDRGDILAKTNPDLLPESSKTHEVVLTYNQENFSFTINPYYGIQSDLIITSDVAASENIVEQMVFLNNAPNPNQPYRTLVQTANGGVSQRAGVDVYGKGKFGPLSPWFSYSYVDFTENNEGIMTGMPDISRHNGRLGATWEVSPKLFITPSLVIRSTPEGSYIPGALTSQLKTPYEINLSVLYRPSAHVEIFCNLRNITDHHYALIGATGDAIPQETFNGVVGLQVRY